MASALILAAGKATRLEGLRETYAKANVPVGDTTPLRFLLESFGTTFSDIWINLHFKGEQVRQQAERYAAKGVRLHFLEEETLLGTGGTLLEMRERSGELPDVLVNAKMFTDFDFASMLLATPGTLVLHSHSPLQTFGGLNYNEGRCIQGLCARGVASSAGCTAAVFTGICRPSPAWMPYLRAARQANQKKVLCLIRHGLLPALKDAPDHATAEIHQGMWCEVSTPERVEAAAKQLTCG
ncbi:MAG: sugar phosphate nucleotidyltransferase [Planctomycetota bacterium]|nr:sugar phosphate nucleotidyltransferase [Planctomycetota bacterium]MDA1114469.1 sugar phosphate nucleotidyltransferase [Planctomycetota bacterium]